MPDDDQKAAAGTTWQHATLHCCLFALADFVAECAVGQEHVRSQGTSHCAKIATQTLQRVTSDAWTYAPPTVLD